MDLFLLILTALLGLLGALVRVWGEKRAYIPDGFDAATGFLGGLLLFLLVPQESLVVLVIFGFVFGWVLNDILDTFAFLLRRKR